MRGERTAGDAMSVRGGHEIRKIAGAERAVFGLDRRTGERLRRYRKRGDLRNRAAQGAGHCNGCDAGEDARAGDDVRPAPRFGLRRRRRLDEAVNAVTGDFGDRAMERVEVVRPERNDRRTDRERRDFKKSRMREHGVAVVGEHPRATDECAFGAIDDPKAVQRDAAPAIETLELEVGRDAARCRLHCGARAEAGWLRHPLCALHRQRRGYRRNGGAQFETTICDELDIVIEWPGRTNGRKNLKG